MWAWAARVVTFSVPDSSLLQTSNLPPVSLARTCISGKPQCPERSLFEGPEVVTHFHVP